MLLIKQAENDSVLVTAVATQETKYKNVKISLPSTKQESQEAEVKKTVMVNEIHSRLHLFISPCLHFLIH